MKKILFILLLNFFCLNQISIAEEIKFNTLPEDTLFQNSYCWQPGNQYRPIIPLDGEWEYRISEKDPWGKVAIPSSYDYCGEVTFRRFFTAHSTHSKHYFRLLCYGITYYCMIFINNKFIGSHSGGYNSFYLDIAEQVILPNKKNIIEIKVDTRLNAKNTIPQNIQQGGLKNIGGIYRSIYFLTFSEISVENFKINYQISDNLSECEFNINFDIKDRINQYIEENTKPALKYNLSILSNETKKPIVTLKRNIESETYQLNQKISAQLNIRKPKLWSPLQPNLYKVQVQLLNGKQVIDQYTTTLGLKKLEYKNSDLYLNGERLILKGVNWVEDYLIHGPLFERNQLYNEFELIKQLHVNALRVLNHPPHPMVPYLCDSLGMFLLQEIPINWVAPSILKSDIFKSHSADYLKAIIQRDANHVSSFAWGIGGEFILEDNSSLDFIKDIVSESSENTNQLFYTWYTSPLYPNKIDSTILSGISIFNANKNVIQNTLASWLVNNKNSINLVLSFGAPFLGMSHEVENKVMFEEYEVLQIVEAWRSIANFSEIDGYFISTLSDYYGNYPTSLYGKNEDYTLHPLGLTEYSRKKRISYEVVRSLYQEGKCRYNPGVELKSEYPGIFPLAAIIILVMLVFLVNSRRYFRENFKRIFIHPHGFFVDIRDGRKIPPSHTIFMAFFSSIGCGLVIASILCYFKTHPQIDHLIALIVTSKDLKASLSHLLWRPDWTIAIFTILSFVSFLILALFLKITALFSGKRYPLSQALSMPFWIGANFILLIPIGMVLYRLFNYKNLLIPIFFILLILYIWYFLRLIKGFRVILTWTFNRVFWMLAVTVILTIAALLYYYQYQYALIDYIIYYYRIFSDQIISNFSNSI